MSSDVDVDDHLARMAQNDRVTLATIYKTLATDGTNIDPEEVNLVKIGLIWSRHDRVGCTRRFAFTIELDMDKDITKLLRRFYVDIDFYGQITGLVIESMNRREYDLPMSIGCLEQLERLDVCNCKSLPYPALSKLPHLKNLRLSMSSSSQSLCNFPPEMRLLHLERLEIRNASVSLFPLIQRIVGQLPSLEYLRFYETKFIPDTFHRFTDTVGCQKTLNEIAIHNCDIDENQLETFLFDVLPNFPMVSSLDLGWNNIRTFRYIVQRLDNSNDSRLVYKSVLSSLNLVSNPIEVCLSQNSEERANICRFLRAFSTIGILDGNFPGRRYIERELALNRAGRRLIEGSGSDHPIPLSMWPTVLSRRLHLPVVRKLVDVTGLFYMLRNGPVLLNRNKSPENTIACEFCGRKSDGV